MGNKVLFAFAGLGIGGVLGWLALRHMAWAPLASGLSELDWRVVLLALGAVLFAAALKAWRFKLLLPGETVSATRLFCVTHAGSAVNTLSPLRVFAEVTQTLILTRGDGLKLSKVASGILLGRLFDLLVTANLVGVGLFLLPQLSGFKPVVIPLWAIAGVALVAFLLFGKRLSRVAGLSRIRPLEETLQCISEVRKQGRLLLLCGGLTGVAWMSIGVAAWLVALQAGITLPFWLVSMIIVAVSMFSGAVPAPPGVVGVYEFVAISTLGLFAVAPSAAFTFAVVIHLLIFLPPLVIGLPVLALERRLFRRAAPQALALQPPPAVTQDSVVGVIAR